jgi:hypothetical protein
MSKLRFFVSRCFLVNNLSILHANLFLSSLQLWFSFLQLDFPFTFHLVCKGSYSTFLSSVVLSAVTAVSSYMFGHLFSSFFLQLCVFVQFNNRRASVSSSPYRRHPLLSAPPVPLLVSKFPI